MIAQILVVDDEPDLEGLIQQKFRHQIRDGAVAFQFARDGLEALAALKNGAVDMVVTDINMPRMDGLTLLQKLQEGKEKISTIIVSAYGDMANIRSAMNRGAFDFLTKPIDFLDLEATIAKTIRHIQVLREARERQAAAERAHASLSRYFSPNLAQRLAADSEALDLRGQRRQIATLFTDIAGFTTLVETLEPDVLGPLLNGYLVGMTDVVFRARRNGSEDNRRRDPRVIQRAHRAAQPRGACCVVRAGAQFIRASIPRSLAAERDCARRYPHRGACRPGDRWQFRRWPLFRLHRVR